MKKKKKRKKEKKEKKEKSEKKEVSKVEIKKGVTAEEMQNTLYSEDLSEFCKKHALKQSGTKKELIKRIIKFLDTGVVEEKKEKEEKIW